MTLDAAPSDYANPALHAHGLWIGGHWLPGGGIPVIDPSSGLPLAEVPDAGIVEAEAPVDAAAAAAPGWRAASACQRSEILRWMFTRMIEEAEALAHLIALGNGKALPDARRPPPGAKSHMPPSSSAGTPHPG